MNEGGLLKQPASPPINLKACNNEKTEYVLVLAHQAYMGGLPRQIMNCMRCCMYTAKKHSPTLFSCEILAIYLNHIKIHIFALLVRNSQDSLHAQIGQMVLAAADHLGTQGGPSRLMTETSKTHKDQSRAFEVDLHSLQHRHPAGQRLCFAPFSWGRETPISRRRQGRL